MDLKDSIIFEASPSTALPSYFSWVIGLSSCFILFALIGLSDKFLTGFHYVKVHQHLEDVISNSQKLSFILEDDYVKTLPIKQLKIIEQTISIYNLIQFKQYSRSYKVLESGTFRETPLLVQLRSGLIELNQYELEKDALKRKGGKVDPGKDASAVELEKKCLKLAKGLVKEVTLPVIDPLSEYCYKKLAHFV